VNSTVLHVARLVDATPRACAAGFRSTRALSRWYEGPARLNAFRVGGRLKGSYYPSCEIVAIVPDQLVAHRYTSIVDGVGLWSFSARGRRTRIAFDHIAEGNTGIEVPARTFHWQGLLENLAAFVEGRPMPFVNGRYIGRRPRSVRYETFQEVLQAERKSRR
jgi:hypothetical protein